MLLVRSFSFIIHLSLDNTDHVALATCRQERGTEWHREMRGHAEAEGKEISRQDIDGMHDLSATKGQMR